MITKHNILFYSIIIILCLIIPVSAVITINENVVTLDDDDVLISTTYIHQGSGYIYPEITYKNIPGGATDIDLAFGVNDKELNFISGDYWSPHNTEWTTQHQQTFHNVQINGTYDNELLDYGNSYNTHTRIIDHDVANGSETDRVTSNISFNSMTPTPFVEGGHYTIFWHTEHSGIQNWKPLPDNLLSIIYKDYNGQNKWYILNDVPVIENEVNRLRIYMETQHQIGSHSYKYDIATKLSSDTLQEAIDNYRFKLIDPYGDTSNFNSTWNTTKISTGSTNDTSIKLPLEVGGTYDFTVWWGDGNSDNITTYNQANVTHTYASSGEYDVVIDGTIHGFRFNNVGDKFKLLDISNWGNLRVGNNNGYFYGCENFNSTATDVLDLTGTISIDSIFTSADVFNGNISNWDTSSVTSMDFVFYSADVFNGDISTWDTSSVTSMDSMFRYAYAFNQNISNWDTSSVTSMVATFQYAYAFNQNISNWDTSSVTTMLAMFENNNLFSQNLNGWNVSKVSIFTDMFEDCDGFNSPLNSWDTSSATKMDDMFKDTKNFNQNLSNWDVSKVTDMDEMFENSAIDQDFGEWNVSACTDFVQMFYLETLSTANYDSLLIGWGALPTLASSEAFHGGNSLYSCAAESARNDTLIGIYSWTITDGGLTGGPCVGDTTLPTYNNSGHNTTEAGASVLFYVQYDDDTALHNNGQYIFSTNNTGSWVNESAVNWTTTPEYANVSKTLNSTHVITIGYRWYSDDNEGNTNNTPIYTLLVQDTIPPLSITSLTNTTGNFWHNWTWTNPVDADFNYTQIYINNSWVTNTSDEYYNLSANAHNESTISTKTVDTTGNINATWVNHTSIIPNNAITISNTTNPTVNEGTNIYIDYDKVDADEDTPTFSCNRTDLFTDFSTSTGQGNWTPDYTEAGVYYVDIGVIDGYDSQDNYTMTITVNDFGTPETPTGLLNTTGNFWVNFTWTTGANTDTFNVSQNGSWTNSTVNNYSNDSVGTHNWSNISVYGYNSTSNQLSSAISDNVQIPNNAISISNISASYTLNEGETLSIDADATDPDGESPTFADNSSEWNVNAATGLVSWNTIDGDQGTYNYYINVSDGYGSKDQYNFTVTVTDSTPAAPTNIQNSTSGLQITWNWTKGSNSDYTVVHINGSWYENSTDSEYIFTATPHNTHEIQLREFNSTLGNYSAYTNQTTTIPNNPANLSGIPNKTTTQGVNLTNVFNLSDYFTDLDDDAPTFAVESNNDTTNLTVTIQGDNTVDFNVTATWNGSALVIFNVTDSYGSTDNDSMVFSIVNVSANLNNFTFTNVSISPTAIRENEPFTVTVDVNDSDGTISTAIVKISSTNYTMINTVGDAWSYTFTSTSVPTTYYIQTIYAQDDFGAWNSTSSTLSIDALSSTGTGSSGGISPTTTPTPTPTPKPTTEEIKEEPTDIITNISNTIETLIFPYKTTIFRVNLKTDDRLYIKEMITYNMTECVYAPEIVQHCVVKDEIVKLTVNFDPDTAGLFYIYDNHIKLYDGTNYYHAEFDMYVINLMASINIPENNLNNPSKFLFSSNEHSTISGVRIWWPLVLLVLFAIYSKKKK